MKKLLVLSVLVFSLTVGLALAQSSSSSGNMGGSTSGNDTGISGSGTGGTTGSGTTGNDMGGTGSGGMGTTGTGGMGTAVRGPAWELAVRGLLGWELVPEEPATAQLMEPGVGQVEWAVPAPVVRVVWDQAPVVPEPEAQEAGCKSNSDSGRYFWFHLSRGNILVLSHAFFMKLTSVLTVYIIHRLSEVLIMFTSAAIAKKYGFERYLKKPDELNQVIFNLMLLQEAIQMERARKKKHDPADNQTVAIKKIATGKFIAAAVGDVKYRYAVETGLKASTEILAVFNRSRFIKFLRNVGLAENVISGYCDSVTIEDDTHCIDTEWEQDTL